MNKNEYQRNHTKYSMPIHRIQPNHRLMQKGMRSGETEPLFPRFEKSGEELQLCRSEGTCTLRKNSTGSETRISKS